MAKYLRDTDGAARRRRQSKTEESMKEEIIVEARNLTKVYGQTTALKNADLAVRRGSIYGLVGNNGAGKTTFLKILAGQTFATEGSFTLMGAETPRELGEMRRRTGCLIENPGFYPKLTIRQNLEYYRIQRGIPGSNIADWMLEEVGLSEVAKRKFENLSLGMKQRLGLALALMGEPELLILDEPINGLDPAGIVEIRNLLLRLNQEKGVTILISSHILTELQNIATDYGFLNRGEVVEQISAEKLREKCCAYLEVKVADAAAYAALLETEMLCTAYRVMPGGCIHIMEQVDDIGAYSALAVKHGIGLYGFEMKEINLENYYMRLIGEEESDRQGGERA